jgi:serine/threonine-protein kinase
MGKFMYMAPEQARHKTVDRRSDVYAVGLCLWELVTGKNPFEDVPSGELMAKVGNPSIPPLNTVEPLCPQALSDAVAKALAPDPAQRFQAAEEFRGTLQTILQQIDPLAGAESTSRFMRDAFAAEYQAERRMLATVKEQAKALAADEPAAEPGPSEETLQNAPSPFASRPTPIATPVSTVSALKMDDETPAASRLGLQPEALSFQPTRKPAGSGNHKAHKSNEVHEKETMPSIQLKPEAQSSAAPAPPAPPPSAPKQQIRARVLAKSFDNDATEAATPAIAEPEPLPSIVIDGLPSEPVRTELEMPAATMPLPSPSAPRASKAGLPAQQDAKKPVAKNGKPEKPKSTKETFKETKDLKDAKEQLKPEKPKAKAPAQPPPPQRTDTAILERVPDRPSPGIPVAKAPRKKSNAVWFAVPLIALLGLAGVIAFDVYMDSKKQQPVEFEEAETVQDEPGEKSAENKNAPKPEPAPEDAPQEPTPKEAPKKKPNAPTKVAKAPATPGEGAMRALQGDFDKIVDEGVQRKFKLQLHALEGQVEDKGSDPAFVKKVQDLHEQVKTALAKQQ